jgi:NAD(P)-dependent dehydrogenase (short-subunit alcohol dehydrogenase family)
MRWRHVLITGGSSGLGRALAEALAAPGVTLHLSGRDEARLAAVAETCRARGAIALPRLLDVTDSAGMADWIGGAGPLDLVLANAGVSGGTGGLVEPPAQARRIFATNIEGVLNTVLPALAVMAAQPVREGLRGQVGVVASLAAFVAAPGAPAYCAAKAAVQRWAEALDATERARGIRVSAICPGYVATPMTAQNAFPMPWLMTPEQAAARTLEGLAARRLRIAYPRRLYALARLVGALPPGLRNALMTKLPAKAIQEP